MTTTTMEMMGTMGMPRLDDRRVLSSLVPPRRGDADSETRKQHGCYAAPPPPRREMMETGASWLRDGDGDRLWGCLLLLLHAFSFFVKVGTCFVLG